jgi:hypothetical protein
VISLFPVIASDALHISLFTLMAGGASFAGHALFATLFASQTAGRIYLRLYRPINALVGIGFSTLRAETAVRPITNLTVINLKAGHSFRRENTARALSSKTIFFCAALSAVLASI